MLFSLVLCLSLFLSGLFLACFFFCFWTEQKKAENLGRTPYSWGLLLTVGRRLGENLSLLMAVDRRSGIPSLVIFFPSRCSCASSFWSHAFLFIFWSNTSSSHLYLYGFQGRCGDHLHTSPEWPSVCNEEPAIKSCIKNDL